MALIPCPSKTAWFGNVDPMLQTWEMIEINPWMVILFSGCIDKYECLIMCLS